MQGSLGHIIWTVCYMSVLIGLSAYGIHRYFIIYLYLKNRKRPPVPAGKFEQLPKVTVQLPIFNEVYVAERLLRSVSELDYPQQLLQIQVLDDSTDDTREIVSSCADKLRQRGFNVQCIHRVARTGFKAGALAAGLEAAEGEFLCILDADFVPQPDLLKRTIHFFTDPKIGMIQTRWGHLNRGYSLLTRMQAIFLDGHLLLEQTARSRSGRFFNFNGTAGLWRRSCIEQSGGWQYDTLCEDLDLSYRAQLAGWKFIYLSDVVTPAELPVDMNGFKSQQHRWTKGSIQTCKKLLPTIWRSQLPFPIKLEATGHLMSNFAYLLLAFLCVLLHPTRKRAPRRMGADARHRCADLLRRVGLSRGFLCLRSARATSAAHGENRFCFCRACSPSALAFHSTTRALCWRRSSITNPILHALPNMESNANRSPGGLANIGWRNRCCHWRSWLSRFISPTSFASRLRMASFSRCPFCSCSKAVSCMSVSLHSPAAGQKLILAAHARAPQFPRDKSKLSSKRFGHASVRCSHS